jgi:preprotein translocase subunit SecF
MGGVMELIGKTNIDFIGKKNISLVISSIVAIIGIIGIIQIARGAANMGTDFTGGTSIQLKFAQPVTIEQVRNALARHDLKEANLQEIKEGNKILIKAGKTSLATGKVVDTIEEVIKKEIPGAGFVVESSSEIGPSIGDKLRTDTLKAIALSLIAITIYIAWRFDFKFGVGSTVSVLHDVLAMVAVFFILNKEINLLFITAALTIAGYSMTDTVVVFDRIRENLHKDLKGKITTIFNRSINEVLSRTVVTSLTAFMAALSLFLFGGEVIHDFAFALVAGIVICTYSSIFVASPIVALLEERAVRSKA